jgi:3-hydroxyisobutyrate dehydrogenase
MKTISVLGLGKMGRGIAQRLLLEGYQVYIWNRSSDKATELIKEGAIWVNDPGQAANAANIILSMVSDDLASRTIWEATLSHMQPGSFLIECSTLSEAHVQWLSSEARQKGIHYIDCPVTGLPSQAATGQLTLLVGADPEDLSAIKQVLESFSIAIRHFGPVGARTAYKLMINLMGAIQIAALAEGLALAGKWGLDKEKVIEAIETSAASSPQVVRYVRSMAEKHWMPDPNFTLNLRHKDASYGVALADGLGLDARLGRAAMNWFKEACAQDPSHGQTDEAAVIGIMV